MTITDFLLARIAEDEAVARAVLESHDPLPPWAPGDFGDTGAWQMGAGDGPSGYTSVIVDAARVLADCEAKRRIVELHRSWPVLVETPPKFSADTSDLTSLTMRMSQQVMWATEQEYRERFGSEPPTVPMLRALAAIYADHPDYDEGWRP